MFRTHSLHLDYPKDKLVKKTRDAGADDDDENENDPDIPDDVRPFSIRNPGDCTSENQYGYTKGKPCVLVKMNKVDLSSPHIRLCRENNHVRFVLDCRLRTNEGCASH
jgi:hypothetical protein